jgi:hypothetical protein
MFPESPFARREVYVHRVTRYVCEKVAQNVGQPIFCQNKYKTGKNGLKFFASIVIFQKLPKSKQPPNRRKFDQSGHPGRQLHAKRCFALVCYRNS